MNPRSAKASKKLPKKAQTKSRDSEHVEDTTCEYCHERPSKDIDAANKRVCDQCTGVKRRPIKYLAPRPQRNKPCPCGSGKKHKHCCKTLG